MTTVDVNLATVLIETCAKPLQDFYSKGCLCKAFCRHMILKKKKS